MVINALLGQGHQRRQLVLPAGPLAVEHPAEAVAGRRRHHRCRTIPRSDQGREADPLQSYLLTYFPSLTTFVQMLQLFKTSL